MKKNPSDMIRKDVADTPEYNKPEVTELGKLYDFTLGTSNFGIEATYYQIP